MSADFFIARGDRLPSIVATLTDAAGTPVDLSGATVQFRFRMARSEDAATVAAAQVLTPATAGKVQYDWGASDTQTAGAMLAEWLVTFAGGRQQTFPNQGYVEIEVKNRL